MNKKKAVAVISAAGLAGVLAVGGTMAYLTNTQSATNTFTVGDVEVGIDEPHFPGAGGDTNDDGIDDTKNYSDSDKDGIPDINEEQVPQQETDKDPMITNKSVSDAVVFVKVTVPVREFTHVNDDGTRGDKKRDELYIFKQGQMATQAAPNGQDYTFPYAAPAGAKATIAADKVTSHANHWNENWTELEEFEEGQDHSKAYRTYVFGYNTRLHGLKSIQDGTWTGTPVAKKGVGETTVPLFQKVQLQNFADSEITPGEIQNITVQTYVIQADNVIADQGVVSTNAAIAKADLATIYRAYVAQEDANVKANDKAAQDNAATGKTKVSENAALKSNK